MSIVIQGKIPEQVILAYSGGPDSSAALRYLSYKGYRDLKCIFFHHGDDSSSRALEHVQENIRTLNNSYISTFKNAKPITLDVGYIHEYESKYKNVHVSSSQEDYWRTYRYLFFKDMYNKYKLNIITAHTLDDCVEEWIINSIIRGRPGLIKYNGPSNVIRPFRLNTKTQMIEYFNMDFDEKYNINRYNDSDSLVNAFTYHNDPENKNNKHMRVRIREQMKIFKTINPGLVTMIRRKLVREEFNTLIVDDIDDVVDKKLSEIEV